MRISTILEECAVKRTKYLPLTALLPGALCLCLRSLLYRTAVDDTGLLKAGTVLEGSVYLLTALSLALFAVLAWKNEALPSMPCVAALGQLAGAVGIGWTVARYPGEMPGVLGTLWRLSGAVAAVCLVWTAICDYQQRKPHFLTRLAPCLFYLVQMLDNYRGWSGRPQLQSYLFDLLATIAMALLAYYRTAADVGLDKPRMRRFTALAAGFLCLSAVLTAKTRPQYLLCVLWALTSLYSPKPEKAE